MKLSSLFPALKKQKDIKLLATEDMDNNIRRRVSSSMIKSIGHNSNSQVLEVEFHNKEVHRFLNVSSQTYDEMMKSKSIGSYFMTHISNQYPNRFVRVKKRKFGIL